MRLIVQVNVNGGIPLKWHPQGTVLQYWCVVNSVLSGDEKDILECVNVKVFKQLDLAPWFLFDSFHCILKSCWFKPRAGHGISGRRLCALWIVLAIQGNSECMNMKWIWSVSTCTSLRNRILFLQRYVPPKKSVWLHKSEKIQMTFCTRNGHVQNISVGLYINNHYIIIAAHVFSLWLTLAGDVRIRKLSSEQDIFALPIIRVFEWSEVG